MPVIVVHAKSDKPYIGFETDTTLLKCSACQNVYRVFFTEEERTNLVAHRFTAKKAIEAQHPKHSIEIFLNETWVKR